MLRLEDSQNRFLPGVGAGVLAPESSSLLVSEEATLVQLTMFNSYIPKEITHGNEEESPHQEQPFKRTRQTQNNKIQKNMTTVYGERKYDRTLCTLVGRLIYINYCILLHLRFFASSPMKGRCSNSPNAANSSVIPGSNYCIKKE